jgi:hypothetical protein
VGKIMGINNRFRFIACMSHFMARTAEWNHI